MVQIYPLENRKQHEICCKHLSIERHIIDRVSQHIFTNSSGSTTTLFYVSNGQVSTWVFNHQWSEPTSLVYCNGPHIRYQNWEKSLQWSHMGFMPTEIIGNSIRCPTSIQYAALVILCEDNLLMFGAFPIKTHWGPVKIAAIFQTTFPDAFSWMKMFKFRLKFHWRLFPRVELTIFQHWFR